MLSCDIVTGLTHTPLIRVYLTPSTMEHLPDLEEALQRFRGTISIGGLNVELDKARSLWIQRVLVLLADYGCIDLV